jgi:DNA-binding NarL/FixJ family response regulator
MLLQASRRGRIRLVVVERNQLVVSALRGLFIRDDRFDLADHLESGEAFLNVVEANQTAFDIAIVGWKLGDMDAADLLAELRLRHLVARVVVFSNEHDIGILKQCVCLGAQGFCYQDDDPSILFDTLVAVAHGRICVPRLDINKINDTPLSRLTAREHELLAMLASGWTNLQIATGAGISENTVKYHLKNLYDKLGARNRAAAVALFFMDIQR